jgi:D-alanyl-D-alanine endopeptidase (penicillin-binding protein 7)
MNPAIQNLLAGIGWTLVHFVWQGALIGCATAIALTLLRNARPEQRYLVACAGLALCLLWPALDLYLRVTSNDAASASVRLASSLAPDVSPETGARLLSWLNGNLLLLVGSWAACATTLALRMAMGLLWIGRAAQHNRTDAFWQARLARMAAQFGIDRSVRFRIVYNLASPITAGWWRPVVLVPASLVSGMPPELLEALLAHELAHVKRFDYLVNLGQNVVETLLFYHPAVWWISNRIRAEREQIADDFAARQLGEPRRLALALSELERIQFSTHRLAQAANGGDLMVRIKRLIRPDRQALNWTAAVPVLGLAAVFASGCAHTPMREVGDDAKRTAAVVDFNSCAKPNYPVEDINASHQGTVGLAFLINTDGRVLDSKVTSSSGFASLDESAQIALAKCRFKPAMQADKPVQEWTKVQYVWALE